jgi:hypothetical protein
MKNSPGPTMCKGLSCPRENYVPQKTNIVAKRFGTYVSLGNLNPFAEKVHYSLGKFHFL